MNHYLDQFGIPFSSYGSYLVLSHMRNYRFDGPLCLRSVHTQDRGRNLFTISLWKQGKEIACEEHKQPGVLRLENLKERSLCEICFENEDTVRFRISGCEVRLRMDDLEDYQLAYPIDETHLEINVYSHKLMLTALNGWYRFDAPWVRIKQKYIDIHLNTGALACAEFLLEEYENVHTGIVKHPEFDTCAADREREFLEFYKHTPGFGEETSDAHLSAAYINWSAFVKPHGNFKTYAMLMSKNWMNSVWSWDHCFTAMALASGDPKAAFSQFMLPFTYQDETGALPDCVGDGGIIRNFVKPPIHGFVLRYMMNHTAAIGMDEIRQIYEPLSRWTDWWFTYRDYDGDGIPQYNHGNDSGWDNALVFDRSPLIEGADLSSFLIIQLEVLGELARLLGKEAEAKCWEERRKTLYDRFLTHFLKDGRIVSVESGSHEPVKGNSLFDFLPLILGKRLPEAVRTEMVRRLKEDGFFTACGLATESVNSEYYEADGYWRGPVWAPVVFLLTEALRELEEEAFADEIAKRYCDAVRRGNMAENMDAESGIGYRDFAYTWTSSVFLLLSVERPGNNGYKDCFE